MNAQNRHVVTPRGVSCGYPHVSQYGVSSITRAMGRTMEPDEIIRAVTQNPITAGLIGTAVAAVVGFFKPILAALQAALVRRIDRAWAECDEDDNVEERVRRTAERVRSSTRLPLSQTYVEDRVRRMVSDAPDAPDMEVQPPL